MKIALGSAQFGMAYGIANQHGQVECSEVRDIISYAKRNGIDTIDTAISYGICEKLLGQIGLREWRIVTKLPSISAYRGKVCDWARTALRRSLTDLKVENLYAVLLHEPRELFEAKGEQVYRALSELKQSGMVEKIGVSIYDPCELERIIASYHFDIVQAPFNVLDRRLIESGWLYRLADSKIELHVRSVFLQGLLLMTSRSRPKKFDRWGFLWNRWKDWLKENEITAVEASIRYALSFPEIRKVIVGVDRLGQLEQIISSVAGPVPRLPDDLKTEDLDLLCPTRWAFL